jgi:hypothetical protein
MKSEGMLRQVLIVFLLALVLYAVTYGFIEHMRTRNGGWQVTFSADSRGTPSLSVDQAKLGIRDVQLLFPNQHISLTNFTSTVVFDDPRATNTPFGKVIYVDTTFLPGSVVFELFGHEVQIIPRVLLLDRKEFSWRSGSIFRVEGNQLQQGRLRP